MRCVRSAAAYGAKQFHIKLCKENLKVAASGKLMHLVVSCTCHTLQQKKKNAGINVNINIPTIKIQF